MKHFSHLFQTLQITTMDTLRFIVAQWKKFLPLVLIPAALSFLLTISTRLAIGNAFARMDSFASLFSVQNLNSVLVVILTLCAVLIQLLGIITIIYITTHHEESNVFHAIEESTTYLWRFIVCGICIFAISILALVIGYIPVWLVGIGLVFLSPNAFAESFYWVELIARGISAIAATFFVFAPYLIIEKNSSVIASMRASYALVRTHTIIVIGSLATLSVFGTLLTYTFSYIPRIGSLISALIITPFSTIYIYILYTYLNTLNTTEPAAPNTSTQPEPPITA